MSSCLTMKCYVDLTLNVVYTLHAVENDNE